MKKKLTENQKHWADNVQTQPIPSWIEAFEYAYNLGYRTAEEDYSIIKKDEKNNDVKVKYIGCTDEQANWGRGKDPREHLKLNEVYTVYKVEVHSWHTVIYLKEVDMGFNSSAFEGVDDKFDEFFDSALEQWRLDNK